MDWRSSTHNFVSTFRGYAGVDSLHFRAATADQCRAGLPNRRPIIRQSGGATGEKERCGFDYDPFSINKNRID